MDAKNFASAEFRGLHCRNGVWHINKVVKGIRLCKSLKTSNHEVAVERFLDEVDRAKGVEAEKTWSERVQGMLADRSSWLHATHSRITRRAVSVAKGCSLAPADIAVILARSNGRCEVTGIQFSDEIPKGAKIAPFKESIDRIDSSLGYHPGNCRVVCLAVNLAMRDWGEGVMITIGKAMLLQELQRDLGKGRARVAQKKKDLEVSGF